MKYHVHFYVNGDAYDLDVPANKTMLDVLRDELCLTGTKEGCGAGECGACTVIVDDVPLNACLVLAPELDGVHITTVEACPTGRSSRRCSRASSSMAPCSAGSARLASSCPPRRCSMKIPIPPGRRSSIASAGTCAVVRAISGS